MTPRPPLFHRGDFTLASGQKSNFKIECDALTREDWEGLAAMAVEILPPFWRVEAVPMGGVPFAKALWGHVTSDSRLVLVVDDVWTTGGTMHRFVSDHRFVNDYALHSWLGVVAFARNPPAPWCRAVFEMGGDT